MFRLTIFPLLFLAACQAPPREVAFATLLRREVAPELARDREVIVSRVDLPPHTTLPWHWHPGEEFVYVLDGEVTAHIGEEGVLYRAGAAAAVPLRAVHTGSTGAKGARLLVFRVHMKGQPERHVVDAPAGHEHPHDHGAR